MREEEFIRKINSLSGKAYVVGGWVRDWIRGVAPKDKDYMITGVSEEEFTGLFPQALRIGKAFPVYLLEINGASCEVAFARRERKMGSGYKGFEISFDKEVSVTEDLGRRDTTMNSIALDLQTLELVDPFQGKLHILERRIVPTSQHFKEDPVRALRAARQAAQFQFFLDEATRSLMRECRAELAGEPKERLFGELKKALECQKPSVFFRVLQEAELLAVTFPQLHALIGQAQPAHPEGEAFHYSLYLVDRVAERNLRVEVRFAALVHDLGKSLMPGEKLPSYPSHEVAGLDALQAFNRQIGLPHLWLQCAAFAIRYQRRVSGLKQSGQIVDFILALQKNPIGITGFRDIVVADRGSIPDCLLHFDEYLSAIKAVKGTDAPSGLQGKKIGQWVRQQQILMYNRKKADVTKKRLP